MYENPFGSDLPIMNDDPLGGVELASGVSFGARAAALAGITIPAGRPSVLNAPAGLTPGTHISCSSVTI
jgi:hypothetical protein